MGLRTAVAVCCIAVLVMLPNIDGAGECPATGQVHLCSPKCLQNTDCTYGKLCCTNQCHTKSCVEPKTSGTSGYKGSGSNTGTGVYCNNVKCNAFEKCEMDRSSKRMKCVRA